MSRINEFKLPNPDGKTRTIECIACGQVTITTSKRQKYCSKACYKEATHERERERNRKWVAENRPAQGKRQHSGIEDITVTCQQCGESKTYRGRQKDRERKYCSKACWNIAQKGQTFDTTLNKSPDLTSADLGVIETIWKQFGYLGLETFGTRSLLDIYNSLSNKEGLYEWMIYTILFQSHIEWRYDTIVELPEVDKGAYLGLCDKFKIRFMDSDRFDSDMEVYRASIN